jgi:hypothetical protein
MGSAAGAIIALLASVALPGVAAAQDMPPMAAAAAPDEAYRYIDDADALLDAMGTSPPDYGFSFDGVDCWAWTMDDGSIILAEPLGDDYRYYVFSPDDGYPFFVGDQFYAYGFDEGSLAAVYGADGNLVDATDDIADGAAWLSERGVAMKRAMQDRQPVYADDWADSLSWFGAIELRLDSWRNQPGWIRYRAGPGRVHHRDWRVKLGAEGQRRRQRAEWFDQWRRGGYRGAPQGGGKWVTTPGRVTPGKGAGPGDGPGKGNWIGRPRPVAPPTPGTPGTKPGGPGRGDGTGPGRRPHPPRVGQPVPGSLTPILPVAPVTSAPLPPPVVVSPPPAGDGRGRPMRSPPRMQSDRDISTVLVPSVPTPPPTPAIPRGEGRLERPVRVAPQPPAVKIDRGRLESQPEGRTVSPRPEPSRLPPPVAVAPRPTFSPPRVPVSAPPPPPPPPAAAVTPVPSVVRSGGSASGPRSGGSGSRGGGAPRGDGGGRSGGKGKDK